MFILLRNELFCEKLLDVAYFCHISEIFVFSSTKSPSFVKIHQQFLDHEGLEGEKLTLNLADTPFEILPIESNTIVVVNT